MGNHKIIRCDRRCQACGTTPIQGYKYCSAACAKNNSRTLYRMRCQKCGIEFGGRKRKYCTDLCARRALNARKKKTERTRRLSTPIINGRRECLICGATKLLSELGKNSRLNSGYKSYCKTCIAELVARCRTPEQRRLERQRRAEKQGRAYQPNRYRQLSQAKIAVLVVRNAKEAWNYWLNVLAPASWLKSYRLSKAAVARDMRKDAWRRRRAKIAANPSLLAEHRIKTQHKKAKRSRLMVGSADASLSVDIVNALYAERKRCPYCACALKDGLKHLDHMDPLTRGGQHSAANLIVCCRKCNSAKGNKSFPEWLRRLPAYYAKRARAIYEKKRGAAAEQIGLRLVA